MKTGETMDTAHISDVDLTLYASGYQHFSPDALRAFQMHLKSCELCGDRLERYIESAASSQSAGGHSSDGGIQHSLGPSPRHTKPLSTPHTPKAENDAPVFRFLRRMATVDAARWSRWALAACLVLACGLVWAGNEIHSRYVQNLRDLQEITRLRQEAAKSQAQYDQAWSALRFEDVVKPVIRILPAESGGKPNRVRVELSPRIEEGLVRDVSVGWGDAEAAWEPIYEAHGTARGFQAVHEYQLPPAGQTRQWTLRVLYAVPDAVAAARRLTPDQLTSACQVEATADGLRLLVGTDVKGPAPELAAPGGFKVAWLTPTSGAEVGWKVRVTVQSPSATELLTLLVRPVSGNTFYVQSGARRLPAGTPESFDVQLGGGPESAIGADFDIVAVCDSSFLPSRWSLDVSQVPHSAIAARITVRKTAGTIRVAEAEKKSPDAVDVEGAIWTTHGGALLTKEDGHYRVLKAFPPAIDGNRFSESLPVKEAGLRDVYLLVHREGDPALEVGQTLADLPPESRLYKCGIRSNDAQTKPLEEGDGR